VREVQKELAEMSTKCSIYYQAANDDYENYLHVYWDMGGHRAPGIYVDTGIAVRVANPAELCRGCGSGRRKD
jgi:hypothetical protein